MLSSMAKNEDIVFEVLSLMDNLPINKELRKTLIMALSTFTVDPFFTEQWSMLFTWPIPADTNSDVARSKMLPETYY